MEGVEMGKVAIRLEAFNRTNRRALRWLIFAGIVIVGLSWLLS